MFYLYILIDRFYFLLREHFPTYWRLIWMFHPLASASQKLELDQVQLFLAHIANTLFLEKSYRHPPSTPAPASQTHSLCLSGFCVVLAHAHMYILRQGLMWPKLVWNLLCRQEWPWTFGFPASTSNYRHALPCWLVIQISGNYSVLWYNLKAIRGGKEKCENKNV